MAYCSLHMPIGWNGWSMPTEGCSVFMPIVINNFKVRVWSEQHSVLYVMKVEPTHISVQCEFVEPNVY